MNAREYLEQVSDYKIKVEQRVFHLETLCHIQERTRDLKIQCGKLLGPHTLTNIGNDFQNQLADGEKDLQDEVQGFLYLKSEISDMLSQLPDNDEQLILEKRYINGEKWERIQNDLHLSKSSVFRKHRSALKNLDEILKNVGT